LVRRDGTEEELPGKWNGVLARDEALCIETPGGGGWGPEEEAER